MGKGKSSVVVMGDGNPLTMLKSNHTDFETHLKHCLSKSLLLIETAIKTVIETATATTIGAAEGVASSVFFDTVAYSICLSFTGPSPAIVDFKTIIPTRALVNSVVMGAAGGITCLTKRLRGKDDVDIQTSMVATFGTGVLFALIMGVHGAEAILHGVSYALTKGGIFKVKERFSKARAEDTLYRKTRSMLHNLGLDEYERNFKKGLLTDKNLRSLNNGVLEEVKIPPGARKLILDHVQSEEMSRLHTNDQSFDKTRSMLSSLGLDEYLKNFKKGLLTDECLPLLKESDLKEVEIPVGARHLILNHIKKGEKEVK